MTCSMYRLFLLPTTLTTLLQPAQHDNRHTVGNYATQSVLTRGVAIVIYGITWDPMSLLRSTG